MGEFGVIPSRHRAKAVAAVHTAQANPGEERYGLASPFAAQNDGRVLANAAVPIFFLVTEEREE